MEVTELIDIHTNLPPTEKKKKKKSLKTFFFFFGCVCEGRIASPKFEF